MKEDNVLFYLPSENIPQGGFEIHKIPDTTQPNDTVRIGQWSIIFQADGSLAGDFISIGEIRKLFAEDKVVGVVYHPDDDAQIRGG